MHCNAAENKTCTKNMVQHSSPQNGKINNDQNKGNTYILK